MDALEQLIAAADAGAGDIWHAIPASKAVISACESRLGVTLPPSYINFLEKFGALTIGDSTISGVLDDALDDLGGGSVLGDTLRYREEWQLYANLVVIQADDDARYCLDTGGDMVANVPLSATNCTPGALPALPLILQHSSKADWPPPEPSTAIAGQGAGTAEHGRDIDPIVAATAFHSFRYADSRSASHASTDAKRMPVDTSYLS